MSMLIDTGAAGDRSAAVQTKHIASALQALVQGCGEMFSGTIDGGIKIRTCFGGKYLRRVAHAGAKTTGFTLAGSRTSFVGETGHHTAHLAFERCERGFKTFDDMGV